MKRFYNNGNLAVIDRDIDFLVEILVLDKPTPEQLSTLKPVLLAVTLLTDRYRRKKLEIIKQLLKATFKL